MNILEIPVNIQYKLKNPYNLGLLAAEIMQRYSQDPKKQTGAAIIRDYNILGLGSNIYPYKRLLTPDDIVALRSNNFNNEYRFHLEHAERNAIAFAIRNGNYLKDTTLAVTYTPCVDCANSICNFGITRVIDASIPNFTHPRWGAGWQYTIGELFPKCGVEYINHEVDPGIRDKVLFGLERLIDKYYKHTR